MSDFIDHLLAKNTNLPDVVRPRPISLFEPAQDVPWMPPAQSSEKEAVDERPISNSRMTERTHRLPLMKWQSFVPPNEDEVPLPPTPGTLQGTSIAEEKKHDSQVHRAEIKGIEAARESAFSDNQIIEQGEEGLLTKRQAYVSNHRRVSSPFPSTEIVASSEEKGTALPVSQEFQNSPKGKQSSLFGEPQAPDIPFSNNVPFLGQDYLPLSEREMEKVYLASPSGELRADSSILYSPTQPSQLKPPRFEATQFEFPQQQILVQLPGRSNASGAAVDEHTLMRLPGKAETPPGDGMYGVNLVVQADAIRQPHSDQLDSSDMSTPIQVAAQAIASSPRMPFSAITPSTSPVQASAPTIQVTIGRVEVRAIPAPLAPKKQAAWEPKESLQDYLQQRNGGRR